MIDSEGARQSDQSRRLNNIRVNKILLLEGISIGMYIRSYERIPYNCIFLRTFALAK